MSCELCSGKVLKSELSQGRQQNVHLNNDVIGICGFVVMAVNNSDFLELC